MHTILYYTPGKLYPISPIVRLASLLGKHKDHLKKEISKKRALLERELSADIQKVGTELGSTGNPAGRISSLFYIRYPAGYRVSFAGYPAG